MGKGFRNGLVQSPFYKRRTGGRGLRKAVQGPAAHLHLQPGESLLTMSFKTSQVWLAFLLPLPLCPPLWVLFLCLKKLGCCAVSISSLSPTTTLSPNKSNHHHFPPVPSDMPFFYLQCSSFPGKPDKLLGFKAQLQMRLAFPGRLAVIILVLL